MGQELSRRHSSDTLSLFPPLNDSVSSIPNDYRLDDIINNNYRDKKIFRKCRKLSRIKKSFSECFRSNFTRLQEIEDDNNNNEIMNSPRPNSEQSQTIFTEGRSRRLTEVFFDHDLPRDIHEIHDKLSSLMHLLNQAETDNTNYDKRDASCQTINNVQHLEQLIRQKDSLISDQQDKLNSLHLELDKKDRTIERYTRDLAIMKTQQVRHRLDIRNVTQIVAFLHDMKTRQGLDSSDLEKVDNIIYQLNSVTQQNKPQSDKANVAVIIPCANVRQSDQHISPAVTTSPISYQNSQSMNRSSNPFGNPFEDAKDHTEVKLICFLDNSVTPYISAIPLPSSKITLAHVKYYTKSVVPNHVNCRYIFKAVTSESGQVQEEMSRDSDTVPVHDNKIIVRIRM